MSRISAPDFGKTKSKTQENHRQARPHKKGDGGQSSCKRMCRLERQACNMMTKTYTVQLDYKEFRNNFCEDWGDTFFHDTFDKHVDDDMIEIEYKYGKAEGSTTVIKWRLPADDKKKYVCRYGSSSRFAAWWCNQTDSIEDGDD